MNARSLVVDRKPGDIGICLLLLMAAMLTACAGMRTLEEPPRISLVNLQPGDMTLLEQRFGVRLRILNPNNTPIPIAGLSCALEINDREFAYGVSQQDVTIPPFGEVLLDVDMVSNLLNVMQQLRGLSGEEHNSFRYRLKGNLALANRARRLPFDYHGELEALPARDPGPAGSR
jgi:LEA14-like dessication related protein